MKRRAIGIILATCIPLGLIAGLFVWFSRDLPSTDDLISVKPWTRTIIYDIHGQPLKAFYEEDRVIVSLDQVPRHLANAFIAIEDRQFYRHWGLNVFAIAKAVLEDVMAGKIVRGASTITQQLARNLFLTQEQTLTRKIKEAILAIRIERHYTKDEILAMYLNQIYFGEGAYGVGSAATKYFGKNVTTLSLAESAMLAGIPRNPLAYSPTRYPDRAKQRQSIVLRSMVEMDMITARQAAEAKNDTITVSLAEKAEVGAYFTENIRRILEHKYGSAALYREGLKVHTTIDLSLQELAEQVVERNLRAMEKRLGYQPKDTTGAHLAAGASKTDYIQGALIALDPKTGYIKAMVGGRDFLDSEWNRATQAPRQPGSAFKIFVYTAAIDNGMTTCDIIMDDPIVMENPADTTEWRPQNFDEEFRGPVTVREALARSINIPAIKVGDRIGQETVVRYAHRMGIRSELRPYRSIALGTFEVTLLELTSAVGVLANSGIRAEPIAITRIEARDGRILEENPPRRSEAISAQTAYVVTSMLQSVVNEGTGQSIRARGITRNLAGKTGTTDEYGDAWFVGFSPDLVTGVWVGFDERQSLGKKETGARVALPIWIDFMTGALEAIPDRPFPEPHGIVRREICPDSGLLATGHCPEPKVEVFISGTEPLKFCHIHRGNRSRDSVSYAR